MIRSDGIGSCSRFFDFVAFSAANRCFCGEPRHTSPENAPGLRETVMRVSWEATMQSVYECGSVVPGCRFVAHGESHDDVLVLAIEHMHRVHAIEHLPEPLKARIRAAIKEAPVRREAP